MRKLFFLVLFLGTSSITLMGQQDPMFTKYMFNGLVYNPAFAGSPGYLSARVLYRNQWLGLEGAPTTQSFTIHSPWKERVGIGLSILNDKIGATNSTSGFASYAYHVDFGGGKLSMALQAGAINWRADWNQLRFKDPQSLDNSFNQSPNKWLPNFGAGVFYYAPKFYVGFAVPHLLENDLNKKSDSETESWAQLYRHYYVHAGAAFPIQGEAIIFKPSILVKSVGLLSSFNGDPSDPNTIGAPSEFDLDLSLLFYRALWLGVSFRSAFEAEAFGGKSSFDSADIWCAYYLQGGLRIGLGLRLYADRIARLFQWKF